MRAAWYDNRGPAHEVLVLGQLPTPDPGPGEVRIKMRYSGMSPGDVKKRSGWLGSPMPFPRVIPHSDGAGVVDAVGQGVNRSRIGETVWCYGAQSYRAFGTAAEYTVVPSELALTLPDDVSPEILQQAASLGIAGITGYRAVFADGSVNGLNVLVYGAAGGVGSIATQMAIRDGASVTAVVRTPEQREIVRSFGVKTALHDSDPDLVERIRQASPGGIHRVADVDFNAHIDINAEVIAVGGVISAYYSSNDRPRIPYWKLGFADTTLRLLGSDDFPPAVKAGAATELTQALVARQLKVTIAERLTLNDIAVAHELVEHGTSGKVVISI
ncbi:NADPH:quinone reductase [Smaragdicoccus niigatensis]|uniref:NADPH:quinone reductase n=1 Tax=Smaragdicoccus niigatensis TaxID=359359 RepID=UPI00039C3F70|nr:NADPH:quinone reductase [Smaragdicoccus niigatensis]